MLALLYVGVLGCDRVPVITDSVHPTVSGIPYYQDARRLIAIDPPLTDDSPIREVVQKLQTSESLWRLGVLEGSQDSVFGLVQDASVVRGMFYVLDARFNEVRVFDISGRFLERFGRPGRGPYEFIMPVAIASSPEGHVVVVDRAYRFNVFELQNEQHVPKVQIRTPFSPTDVCLIGERIFLLGWNRQNDKMIHEYTLDGDTVQSFGEAYNTEYWVAQLQLSRGVVGCDASSDTVILAFERIPLLYGFSSRGQIKWVRKIPDFRIGYAYQVMMPDGRRAVSSPAGVFDRIANVIPILQGCVALQVARRDSSGSAQRLEYTELLTYVIRARDGRGTYVGSAVPKINAVTESHFLTLKNDPYPQIELAAFTGS
jgi:hypothetical protein